MWSSSRERAIAVRVKKHDAFARLDVLRDEPLEKGGLAGAGFADGVEVVPAISAADAERHGGLAAVPDVLPYECDVVVAHEPKAAHPATRSKEQGRALRRSVMVLVAAKG